MKSASQKIGAWACSFLVMATPAFGQWTGHAATLDEAQLACHDIDSSACLPFLAEAVAVGDILTTQAGVRNGGDKQGIQLPGPNGSNVKCSERFRLPDLNGITLTHLALTRNPHINFYWSNALFVAALDLCERSPN